MKLPKNLDMNMIVIGALLIVIAVMAVIYAPEAEGDEIVVGPGVDLYTVETEDMSITTGTLGGEPVSIITIKVEEDSVLPEDVWYPLEGGDFEDLTISDPVPRGEIELP